MAKRVIPEEIVELCCLYVRFGNFAEIGKQMRRCGSTVSKYTQMNGEPQSIKLAGQNLSQ